MTRLLVLAVLLFCGGLIGIDHQASHANLFFFPPGPFPTSAAAGGGPGNVIGGSPSVTYWYGMRAFNAADQGNQLVNVCNVSDVACADLSSDATTGDLVVTTIGGSDCSMVTCTIKTWYDRSGHAADATQASIADRATFVVNCQNGHPCAAFSGNQFYDGSYPGGTNGQTSIVMIRTANFTTEGFAGHNVTYDVGFASSADTVEMFGGGPTRMTAAAADSAWHAVQAHFVSGGTSELDIDGSSTTGSFSTLACTGQAIGNPVRFCLGFIGTFTGKIAEFGTWDSSGFSGAQITALNANQHSYWGF